MQSLAQIISALKQEIDAALPHGEPRLRNVKFEADRVVITVNFSLLMSDSSPQVMFGDGASNGRNSISIEFKCSPVSSPGGQMSASIKAEPTVPQSSGVTTDDLMGNLSKVFGAPGFDSSARATVFGEALSNVPNDSLGLLIDALSTSDPAALREETRRSFDLVQRICNAGPAGAAEGKRILAQILRRTRAADVIRLVEKEWKTQEDWLG